MDSISPHQKKLCPGPTHHHREMALDKLYNKTKNRAIKAIRNLAKMAWM